MGLALARPIDVQTSSLVIIIDSCRAWCNTGKDSDFYCAFSTLALFTQLLKQNAVVQREESSLACYSVHISAGQLFLYDFMVLILSCINPLTADRVSYQKGYYLTACIFNTE